MKCKRFFMFGACLLSMSASVADNRLFFDRNISELTYGDYNLKQVTTQEDSRVVVGYQLRRAGQLLYEMHDAMVVEAALFPALGRDNMQELALQRFTGGAHCCFYSAVFQLKPEFRIVFDSMDYGESLGYGLAAEDLNGDGVLELMLTVLSMDYFYVLPHASSPLPLAIFQFEEASGVFKAANHKFPDRVKGDLEELTNRLPALRAAADIDRLETYHPYLSAVAEIAGRLAYAGEAGAARAFLEDEYMLADRPELLSAFDERLANCSYFRAMMGERP